MVGIYKITNIINEKVYIGQSINILERWKQHNYKAFNSNEIGYNSAIHAAFRKYGIENFKLDILEECEVSELDEKERLWIEKLNSLSPNGYNILVGGQKYRITKTCESCKAPLYNDNITGFCRECYNKKLCADTPNKESLYKVLKENKGNFTKVAKVYNVSDNAVRKWCKRYNLPYHSKDYK